MRPQGAVSQLCTLANAPTSHSLGPPLNTCPRVGEQAVPTQLYSPQPKGEQGLYLSVSLITARSIGILGISSAPGNRSGGTTAFSS